MNRSHIICLALALSAFLVYWDVAGHQFVICDDPVYVSRNPYVQSGLSLQSVKWAFTTTRAEFWHPLTWLSYMLDTQLFGGQPAGYLFTNLLLHVVNSILVYLIFMRMTGVRWPSAFVAALFALHPLHVESVAWIAERKDVLSAVFWLLATYAYIHYVERRGPIAYLALCLFLVLGLMAKPMLVTLPCVLLLLDYWPLGRFKPAGPLAASIPSGLGLIREKIPLFIIAIAFSLVAFWIQRAGGGIDPAGHYPFGDRIYNAVISYAAYLFKMIWPDRLAVFYPFPDNFPAWKVGGAAFLLTGITLLALKSARRYPFFIVGWLWYLGTLVPVIGLVKIGDFAMADRYMYIPMVGVSIIIAWGAPVMLAGIPLKRIVLAAAAVIALSALSLATYRQVPIWTSSSTLFEHALQVTAKNYYAHYGLGHALAGQGRWNQAAGHFLKAVQIKPAKATLHNDLGRVLAGQGKFNAAAVHLSKALEIKPHFPEAHFNLANVMVANKEFKRAVYHFAEALRLHTGLGAARDSTAASSVPQYHELVSMYASGVKLERAVNHLRNLLAANPDDIDALRTLAVLYSFRGDYDNALALLQVDQSVPGRKRDIVRGYSEWSLVKSR